MTTEQEAPIIIGSSFSESEGKPLLTCAKIRWGLFVLVFALALLAGHFWNKLQQTDGESPSITRDFQRGASSSLFEERIASLEARLKALEAREASAPAQNPAPAQSDPALKEQLSTLQTKVEHSAQTTASALPALLAFVELRSAALTGQPFAAQIEALRRHAGDKNAALTEALAALAPAAAQGAPTLAALQKSWETLAHDARAALAQSAALTWQERILAALDGLVRVRPLREEGGKTLPLQTAQQALERGDYGAALAALAALPPEVQERVKDWRAKLQARADIETHLATLAATLLQAQRD